jgi:hypothetical protein
MQFLSIVALSIVAAVTYGIIHDQITARICVEYFTIGHPRLIDSNSPTLLALFWGVIATWWVGLPLGVGLAVVARLGKRPQLRARDLLNPLRTLLVSMFCVALLAGAIGYMMAIRGDFQLNPWLTEHVPPDRHVAFIICQWAHSASYLAAFLGAVALGILTWRRRAFASSIKQTR